MDRAIRSVAGAYHPVDAPPSNAMDGALTLPAGAVSVPATLMLYVLARSPQADPLHFCHLPADELQRMALVGGLVTVTTAGSRPRARSVSRSLTRPISVA